VEEMADLYLEALRRHQPHGPHLLGGYSGGGIIALEMAQQLTAAGGSIDELVLLDTFHPSTSAKSASWGDHLSGVMKEGTPYFKRCVDAAIERHFVWPRQDRRLRAVLKRNGAVPHELREWHLATSLLAALKRYTPKPYAGRVTLFRAKEMARPYEHVGTRLGWDEQTLPNLDVIEVPGGHHSLVREPNVRVLAAGLDAVLLRGASVKETGR
jgi:thioesterase domain-containing protein